MYLKRIQLKQFKNLNELDFEPKKGLNFIIGDNGVGKTNLLDAIHYCCMTKSYFQKSDKNCIEKDTDFFRIESTWNDQSEIHELNVKCKLGGVRQVEYDGHNYKKASDHLGRIPVVMITPNEVYTFIHESEERRKFMNQTLVQLDRNYLEHLSLYNKVLIQKNALLKSRKFNIKQDEILLQSYEEVMAKSAAIIYTKRKELIEKIVPLIQLYSLKISAGLQKSNMEYFSHAAQGDLLELWKKERDLDMASGRIHSGIHRDKIECLLDDESLRSFGSQGQIKTYVMAMRLAQAHFLMEQSNQKPIILLDDVFAKLDEERVKQLISLVEQIGIEQCFITDTHLDRTSKISEKRLLPAHTWHLSNQKISLYA